MSEAELARRRKAFGKWLKGELWRAELTQAEFARRAGATPSQVSFWVRGERTPEPKSCEAIAAVLGLDVAEVMARAGHLPADLDETDEETRATAAIMRRLPEAERREVEAFARFRLERHQRRQRLGPPATTAEAEALRP